MAGLCRLCNISPVLSRHWGRIWLHEQKDGRCQGLPYRRRADAFSTCVTLHDGIFHVCYLCHQYPSRNVYLWYCLCISCSILFHRISHCSSFLLTNILQDETHQCLCGNLFLIFSLICTC